MQNLKDSAVPDKYDQALKLVSPICQCFRTGPMTLTKVVGSPSCQVVIFDGYRCRFGITLTLRSA